MCNTTDVHRRAHILCAVLAVTPTAIAQPPPRALACLATHYALTPALENGQWMGQLPDGTSLHWDDGKAKTLAEALDHPDLEDTLARPYQAGAIRPVTDPDEDPGRVRLDALFLATYPKGGVEPAELFGTHLRVHRRALPAFRRVDARLKGAVARDPSLAAWLTKLSGTFVERTIAGTDRPSSHSYGISIDLDSSRTHYWRWQRPAAPLRWRNTVPQTIVDAFEAEGFIWGGRWYHYDTMHFEYRPELLDPRCHLGAP
jgi:hypothetical protein